MSKTKCKFVFSNDLLGNYKKNRVLEGFQKLVKKDIDIELINFEGYCGNDGYNWFDQEELINLINQPDTKANVYVKLDLLKLQARRNQGNVYPTPSLERLMESIANSELNVEIINQFGTDYIEESILLDKYFGLDNHI